MRLPNTHFGPQLLSIFLLAALHGCATRTVQHHIAAYEDCVFAQAKNMIGEIPSEHDIARLASAQCESNLALINQKLREDNAWMEHYGSNADGYTEKLRERTNADVIEEIRKIRSK